MFQGPDPDPGAEANIAPDAKLTATIQYGMVTDDRVSPDADIPGRSDFRAAVDDGSRIELQAKRSPIEESAEVLRRDKAG